MLEDLEESNRNLKQAQVQLVQSERLASLGLLSAGVAHEINNPLSFIISNLNTLESYAGNIKTLLGRYSQLEASVADLNTTGVQELKEEIRQIKEKLEIPYILEDLPRLIAESCDGARRIKEIVQGLRTFSRADEAELESADINGIIDSTLKLVWNELKYKAEVVKEYGQLPPLLCHPQQLSQVFMNLMINAAQAIEKKGKITLKTYQKDSDIFIEVSDTGCGIPPEVLPHIFEPFFTTKEVGKGTGLGLSIVQGIIQAHGGTIRAQSRPGGGSRFTIRLPIVAT
jgi:two-component system NtrC family sensor kinase